MPYALDSFSVVPCSVLFRVNPVLALWRCFFRLIAILDMMCSYPVDLNVNQGFSKGTNCFIQLFVRKKDMLSLGERLWVFWAAALKEVIHCAISGLPREYLALIWNWCSIAQGCCGLCVTLGVLMTKEIQPLGIQWRGWLIPPWSPHLLCYCSGQRDTALKYTLKTTHNLPNPQVLSVECLETRRWSLSPHLEVLFPITWLSLLLVNLFTT